jgi:sRNA-binding carbon storage regulator CsrA
VQVEGDAIMTKQKHKKRRVYRTGKLVLATKANEKFVLFDMVSGISTTLKVFYRNNGNLAIAFTAPKQVRISREQQWSAESGNTETD